MNRRKLPENGVEKTTIVIFGAAIRPDGTPSGAMRVRVHAAARFGGASRGVRYMPTGGRGRFGPPEAEIMAQLLRADGVRPEQIELEPTGTNTIRSVRACARLIGRQGGAVYAASSSYHLPRCVMLLRLAGLDGRACPPPHEPASRRRFRRWFWRLREVVAVPVDGALMLWLRLAGRV